MVQIDPLTAGYTEDRLPGLNQQLRDRLRQIPGVRSVSYSMYSPQDGDSWNDGIAIQGRPPESTQDTERRLGARQSRLLQDHRHAGAARPRHRRAGHGHLATGRRCG